MNALAIIQLVMLLLTGVAKTANQAGLVLVGQAASNAILELQKIHNTDVTKAQLESLEVQKLW